MRDWISTQPKIETVEGAQGTIKSGAQVWKTVSEDEKQVCIFNRHVFTFFKPPYSNTERKLMACWMSTTSALRSGARTLILPSCAS